MTVGAHYNNTLGVHYSLGVMQEGGAMNGRCSATSDLGPAGSVGRQYFGYLSFFRCLSECAYGYVTRPNSLCQAARRQGSCKAAANV